MRINFTLTFVFLFASAVLADFSREHRSSQFLDVVEKRSSATPDSVEDAANNFAGAVLPVKSYSSSFHEVTGTVLVPHISGTVGSGVSIWVGFDDGSIGDASCGVTFSVGFICTIDSYGPNYTVAAHWWPKGWVEITDIEVSPGDLVDVTVSVSDPTSGSATAMNLNTTKSHTLPFSDQYPVCQRKAGWIVTKMVDRDLATFGEVNITKPTAHDQDDEILTAGGSLVYDITMTDGRPLTDVKAYGTVIQVSEKHVET